MYYFVYDLDETLAEVHSLFYFLMSLKLKNIVTKTKYDENKILFNKLDRAYYEFVNRVADVEKSDKPLGILRPGIIQVMRELEELRETKKIKKAIIYSNNGNLESLEFVKDVILKAIIPSNNSINSGILIQDLIHWGHPGRTAEIPLYYNNKGQGTKRPGVANKTWNVLHQIITKDGRENTDFIPGNVFFFDDLYPEHSIKAELGDNYYRVPKYDFKASSERLGEIFRSVMEPLVANSFDMNQYLKLVQRELVGTISMNERFSDLDNLINGIKNRTGVTESASVPVPEPDIGISMMIDAIGRVKATGGGKRRKNNRTKKRIMSRHRTKSHIKKN
jgi:hypothetical protein